MERFNKSKKQKRIIIGSILGILVVIGSITLYKTFALYKEEKTFNVIRGQVPEFQRMDIELLSFTLDGKNIETAPSKGAYDVSITCNNGAEGYWDYEEWGVEIKNITKQTKCNITFTTGKYFSEYIKDISKSSSNVVKISHEKTEQTPALEDYRYVGSNPDNYVYFGCSENCTEDNLYRVIGVIPTQSTMDGEYENRVKLIKASSWEGASVEAGSTYTKSKKGYRWNTSASNAWESSSLKDYLNGEYYNLLGEYQNYISPTKWYLGAPTYSGYTNYTTDEFYTLERSSVKGKSGGSSSCIENIGLLYPSDYGYSIDGGMNGEVWKEQVLYNNKGSYSYNAWLYQLEGKYYEWTMTPEAIYSDSYGVNAWNLTPGGYINNATVSDTEHIFGVRPTFYLKSDIQYQSGNGSIENPYRIFL